MNVIFTITHLLIEKNDFEKCNIIELGDVDHLALDNWFDNLVKKIPGEPVNILFPLMFGGLSSDLLGLRLALHIRTTPSPFAHANLFIYGTESLYKIRQNEFSCIFSTRGVELVDYNLHVLRQCEAKTERMLTSADLPAELGKMNLKVPTNHFDNHSIANIWGMYRILELAEMATDNIESLRRAKGQLHDIYFKWLMAKNAGEKIVNEEVIEVKKQYAQRLSGIKILGKIKL